MTLDVQMTPLYAALAALLQAFERRSAPPWQTVLEAVIRRYACDAATLMVAIDDRMLRPVAIHGLPLEVLGRHYGLDDNPRLERIAAANGVHRFAADEPLPDPFDGLLSPRGEDNGEDLPLPLEALEHVHDCMGVALRDGQRLIGMLTLDALHPGQLDRIDHDELQAVAALLGTGLHLAEELGRTRERLDAVLTDTLGEREQPRLDGRSRVIARLDEELTMVAATDFAVLVEGETGVGKERVARLIHQRSPRSTRPMVRINCAALSPSLIESELFGHARGAFSGAVRDHRGHFTMADGGTLLLDEIGELPLALQPKLLRALQEGEIQPVGAERVQRVDVRVICATNRDLAAEVAAGRFRADLFHRLGAYPISVPALRERGDDVLLLAGIYLEDNRVRLGLRNLRLSPAAADALLGHSWPGNVRELEHVLGRAALRARGERGSIVTLEPIHLGLGAGEPPAPAIVVPPAPASDTPGADLRTRVDAYQRGLIELGLAESQGNWAECARRLGIDKSNLHRLATRLGLK
ncbi:nitric oxide reductase transcriptional regulator NorR [Halotalea alkalilenta]|uniref:Sigma-54 factor interaction domain-containing protein n=1 Tax=Halotalea alkalilenta TaxID=376489 RepID=A0A172YBG7_9GAMM|nr:nitric oxide reductase transcriptional regulator NorR [Halotalea alkalilenta]ANF56462.1 hypothetical protein A5892_02420 [Halotalea alkalilenta]